MVKIEADKSIRWYSTHCLICGKVFQVKENRVKVRGILMSDREVVGLACEPCARAAMIQQGAKSVKRMST